MAREEVNVTRKDMARLQIQLESLSEAQLAEHLTEFIVDYVKPARLRSMSGVKYKDPTTGKEVTGDELYISQFLDILGHSDFIPPLSSGEESARIKAAIGAKIDQIIGKKKEGGREEKAEEKERKFTEAELKAIEYIKNFRERMDDETKTLSDLIDHIKGWKTALEQAREEQKTYSFVLGKEVEALVPKIKALAESLREKIVSEDVIKRLSSELFDDIKTIEGLESDRNIINHLKAAMEGRTEIAAGISDEELKRELNSDPVKYRNALFLQALLPTNMSTAEATGHKAYVSCCSVVVNDPGLNESINKYFENLSFIKKDLEGNRRTEYLNAIHDAASEINKDMREADAMIRNKNVNKTYVESAIKKLEQLNNKLSEKLKEVQELKKRIDDAVDILARIRRSYIR